VLFERMWMALRSAETEWSSEDFALAMMNLQVRVALFMAAKHPERIAAFRAVLDQLEELDLKEQQERIPQFKVQLEI